MIVMLIIGSHVSFDSNEQLVKSVKEALSYNANTFMFYTGAPQNTRRGQINPLKTIEALNLMKDNVIDINNVICHAPYIINLANDLEPSKYDFSISFLKQEINRCEELGVKYLVLHPGSSVGIERVHAMNNIINALNMVLKNSNIVILLESMAGKGTECGKSIDELKYLIDGLDEKDKIGVCLDTCHLNDSGIDLNNFDEYLDEFDEKIGIDKIKCLHVNDSKNYLGDKKDRHANIGFGTIGFDTLINVIYNDRLKDIPKILETPYVEDYPPYKYEIDMIRKREFNENLFEDIKKQI